MTGVPSKTKPIRAVATVAPMMTLAASAAPFLNATKQSAATLKITKGGNNSDKTANTATTTVAWRPPCMINVASAFIQKAYSQPKTTNESILSFVCVAIWNQR